MKDPVTLVRIGSWAGAIFDAAMIVPMLSPKVGGAMLGLGSFHPPVEYRYAMMVGASLMAG